MDWRAYRASASAVDSLGGAGVGVDGGLLSAAGLARLAPGWGGAGAAGVGRGIKPLEGVEMDL